MEYSSDQIAKRTRFAFIGIRLASVPFWSMISLLSVLLYKTMHITPLQITLLIIIKPMSALFAPYWSHRIHERPDRALSNLAWGNSLRYLPFYLFPG
ncbi:MAG: hypothetical protein LVR00_09885 [Rhabdochlamydiaceae bacterium]|jgi:hypothetical protein